jgi:predicted DNA-binding transcriptional regulator YafY
MRSLASRGCTLKDLAETFAVTTRQIRRDLAEIESEGHPVTCSDDGGEKLWHLPLGYKGLPPITLSPYELMSLQLARAELAYLDGTPFTEDLDDTLAKLKASLPAKTINHYERILHVFKSLPKPLYRYATSGPLLRDLRKALLLQLTIELKYRKPGSRGAQLYRVDPYALVLYQHALYVIGYSHAAKEQRTFSVARMQDLKLTEDRFALPFGYSTRNRFRDLFGLVEDKPHHIVLHVDSTLAHLFEEAQWHPSQEVIRLEDGGAEVRFTAGGLEEIAWWILSYGEAVVVVSPDELVQLVKTHLQNALKRYS